MFEEKKIQNNIKYHYITKIVIISQVFQLCGLVISPYHARQACSSKTYREIFLFHKPCLTYSNS